MGFDFRPAVKESIKEAGIPRGWSVSEHRGRVKLRVRQGADRRVHILVKLLDEARTTSYINQYAKDQWGVTESQTYRYIKRAREIVRNDYTIERPDFLSSRPQMLDEIARASMASWQHSNAVGALRLRAELTRLLGKG